MMRHMGINYHEGRIDTTPQKLVTSPQYIRDMEPLSEGYCAAYAQRFSADTSSFIITDEICYSAGQLSHDAIPEDWLRIVRLPEGFLVDASHLEEFQDEQGRFIKPIEIEEEEPIEVDLTGEDDAVFTNDVIAYLSTDMQFVAAKNILREQYGYELSKSVLHEIVELASEDNLVEGVDQEGGDEPPFENPFGD
jgi:hypothetical protein